MARRLGSAPPAGLAVQFECLGSKDSKTSAAIQSSRPFLNWPRRVAVAMPKALITNLILAVERSVWTAACSYPSHLGLCARVRRADRTMGWVPRPGGTGGDYFSHWEGRFRVAFGELVHRQRRSVAQPCYVAISSMYRRYHCVEVRAGAHIEPKIIKIRSDGRKRRP